MTNQTTPTVTRFAPSPTGHLHIGGARTALFCWAFARRARAQQDAGRFLLRIEDTDRARSSEDAARGILEDLAWLGISWDDGPEFQLPHAQTNEPGAQATGIFGGDARNVGPYHQSQRRDIYDAHFETLIQSGLAYPAFDTPDELSAMRKAAEAEKKSFIYRQPADYDHAAALERAKAEPHVLRFKMPEGSITVRDKVLGDVTFPHEELDDLVIRKTDGFPTYHFAVVVDDALMGVTHILRGQEHLNNTPKHIALQRALGFDEPAYAHLPLIFNPDSTKMSKRDKIKFARTLLAKRVKKEDVLRHIGIDEMAELIGVRQDRLARFILELGESSPNYKDLPANSVFKRVLLKEEQEAQIATRICALFEEKVPEIDVEDFRASGYLPGVLNNYLALLGWNPGLKNDDGTDLERFDMDFLAQHFSFDRIGKSNSKFDRDKLLAFNADTIQHGLTDDRFAAEWLTWAERFDTQLAEWANADPARWQLAAAAARPRTKTLSDAKDAVAFVFLDSATIEYDPKAVKKQLLKGEPNGLSVLPDTRAALDAITDWTPDSIDAAIAAFAESSGHGMGKAAQPLRVALTGTAVSPPLGLTLALLGKDESLARVDRCLSADHAAD